MVKKRYELPVGSHLKKKKSRPRNTGRQYGNNNNNNNTDAE